MQHVRNAALPPLVLVVDDDDGCRMLAQVNLTRLGWRVESFDNGVAALAAARRQLPAAMLIDLRMPVMDGLRLAGAVRGLPGGQAVRLVAYTSFADNERDPALRATRFDAALVKPVSFEALRDVLPCPGSKPKGPG